MAKPKNKPSGGVAPEDLDEIFGDGKDTGPNGREVLDVPYGSYDPSIAAQRRAARRGLSDLRDDTRVAGKWAKKDFSQSLSDISRKWSRGRDDLQKDYRRGKQKIGYQRQDLRRDAGRAREDFGSKLAAIGRQFRNLAGAQKEAQNAAGTLYGGTAAAAAAKRAENQTLARQPVLTARTRMEQDLTTNLARIATAGKQLGADTRTAFQRGKQDVTRDRKLTKIDYRRGKFDRYTKLQRGIREQRIGDADLAEQAVWSARQTNPGAFDKYGRKK